MYSPRLPDRLIPPLFRQARTEGRPMTALAADAIERYLREAGALAVERRRRDARTAGAPRQRA